METVSASVRFDMVITAVTPRSVLLSQVGMTPSMTKNLEANLAYSLL